MIKILLLILSFFLLFDCCQQNTGCPTVTNSSYSLTTEDKGKVPFTGTDTVIFMNNSGHAVTLIGHGKVNNYTTKIIKGAAPPECTQPTQSYEYQMINLASGDPFLKSIDFYLSRVQSPNYYSSLGTWVINGGESYTNYFTTILDTAAYTDTVIVNGQTINCIIIPADTGDISNVLYFNHNYGVLRFILPTNEVWYKQ